MAGVNSRVLPDLVEFLLVAFCLESFLQIEIEKKKRSDEEIRSYS